MSMTKLLIWDPLRCLSLKVFFFSAATLVFVVFIILLYCYQQKYKRQQMNLRFDSLHYYIVDPIELQHYRERNNLGFGEEINTCHI